MRDAMEPCDNEALRRASLIDEATLEWWNSQEFPRAPLLAINQAATWMRSSKLNIVSDDLVTISKGASATSFTPAFSRVKLTRPNGWLDQDQAVMPCSRPTLVGARQRRRAVG